MAVARDRRYESVLSRHHQIVALAAQGTPMAAIARRLGYKDHTSVLHHLKGECKCLPANGADTPAERALAAIRLELREMESQIINSSPVRALAKPLRRAMLAAGLEPRMR